MKLRAREQPEAGIDMTPMIDCVFLLLIFFMCAATMSKVDFTPEVRLPVAPKAAVPEDLRNRGTVNILPLGTPTSAGEVVSEAKPFMVYGTLMDARELGRVLNEKRGESTDFRVYLRVDRKAEFALVRKAIQACAAAGIFDVIFATFQSENAP